VNSHASSTPPAPPPAPPPKRTFWQRRLTDPLIALLTQGVTPDKLAATLAVGTACSMLPFLGLTTFLNLGIGLWLRMNQPIMQTLNYLLAPLHLVMIVFYVRLGERLWGATETPFQISDMLRSFRDASFAEFFQRFGMAGVHAATAWIISVPLIIVGIYYPIRPVMRKLAQACSSKST
jgi:uncharacterized protein (DUF2062 family)